MKGKKMRFIVFSKIEKSLLVILFGLTLLTTPAFSTASVPQASPASTVDITVRVLDGTRFVDDLTIEDFEVLENGTSVKPVSLALVRGRSIVRREGPESFSPDTSRTYYLIFQTVDWDPVLAEAIDHLFSSVLQPGDAVTLITPMKPYALHQDALATQPAEKISAAMQDILKKDIQRGGGRYREITRELSRLSRSISGLRGGGMTDIEEDFDTEAGIGFSLEQQFDHYRNALMTMESLRFVDEKKLVAFADLTKSIPGRKIVYLFYAREYRPEISPNALHALMALYQDNPTVLSGLTDLFQLYSRETMFDADRVKRAFSDAGIVFHFIFMEKKSKYVFGAHMREISEDIFPGFREISAATGGMTEISQNPAASFNRASSISEDYYILSYPPSPSPGGGVFRTARVALKDPGAGYTVINRLGYFAR